MSSEINPTRKRILQTTWQLLEKDGGNATRMADVAKASGISRQALYLHFPNRAELLIETTRYIDVVHDVDALLAPSRSATSGQDRLTLWIEAWGNYIPKVYGVATALMQMLPTDDAAKAAWEDRMEGVRAGCAAVASALDDDGHLTKTVTTDEASDLLFAMLSIRTWEVLCKDRGWSQLRYITVMKDQARRLLLA